MHQEVSVITGAFTCYQNKDDGEVLDIKGSEVEGRYIIYDIAIVTDALGLIA